MKGFGCGFEPSLPHRALKPASALKLSQLECPGKLHSKAGEKRDGLKKEALSKDPDGCPGTDTKMGLNRAGQTMS